MPVACLPYACLIESGKVWLGVPSAGRTFHIARTYFSVPHEGDVGQAEALLLAPAIPFLQHLRHRRGGEPFQPADGRLNPQCSPPVSSVCLNDCVPGSEGMAQTCFSAGIRPHASRLSPMSSPEPASDRRGFRRTLLMVMAVQAFTLLLLWFLQLRYHV